MTALALASSILFIHGSALLFVLLILLIVVTILILKKLFQFAFYAGILILIVLLARALF